jgi:hypothetical protein
MASLMTSNELRRAALILEALDPAGARLEPGTDVVAASRDAVAGLVRAWPAHACLLFRTAVAVVTFVAPLLWLGRRTSFGALTPRERSRLLRRLAASSVPLVAAMMAAMAATARLRLGKMDLVEPAPPTQRSRGTSVHRPSMHRPRIQRGVVVDLGRPRRVSVAA